MDKETFLELVEIAKDEDYRPEWLAKLIHRQWLYYNFFVHLARETKPKLIVELGTHQGRASLHFNFGCPTAKILTCDIEQPFPDSKTRLKKHPNIEFTLCDSVEFAEQVEDGAVDILFCDANHVYESVVMEANAWLPKMKESSIVMFDDIHYDIAGADNVYGNDLLRGEETGMSRFWNELVAQQHGETLEVQALHKSVSFGVLLL